MPGAQALSRRGPAERGVVSGPRLRHRFPGRRAAAGFDGNALGPDALTALGFAFVEVGTVTAIAQPGNSSPPRLFRLMTIVSCEPHGFNNDLLARASPISARVAQAPSSVNIGKTKAHWRRPIAAEGLRLLRARPGLLGCVLSSNVSSLNTPGLRDLQRAGGPVRSSSAFRAALWTMPSEIATSCRSS
ncbi:MAG: hypothetical protein IPG04_40660, partial [Polyangiaceae bacterium]|nr:hypothetical protein [Polyangiaceae bacterium]